MVAREKRNRLAQADEALWQTSLAGVHGLDIDIDATKQRHKHAQNRALALGFSFKPIDELLATGNVIDLVERVETIAKANDPVSEAKALLGTIEIPKVTIREALDLYLTTLSIGDFSRYIINWKLCTTMKTSDVTDTLNMALEASGCDQANVLHKPRLLSDNGSSYISGELANYINENGMSHVRGAPYHPQTQGKIERWHQTLKNRVLLENYFLPGDLERQIESFVEHYNHERYHESLKNVTPADVYFGRAQSTLNRRERIKEKTIEHRRLQYRKAAA